MFFGIIVHFFGISMFLAILFLYYSNNSASNSHMTGKREWICIFFGIILAYVKYFL